MKTFLSKHYIVLLLAVAAGLLALLPVLNAALVIGSDWRGVPQSYGDEVLYFNQIHEIGDGQFWYGNQYLLEHAGGPPLVVFAGHWLAAIPLWLHIPFIPAMVLNDVVWGIVFVLLGFWLLRELALPKWWSAAGALFAYLTCFALMLRPSSRQEVYPFFILFYIALVRLFKQPERRSSIILLGLSTAATFYVFSYLWQTALVTLGLVFLYAIWQRQWPLARGTALSGILGVLLGAPQLIYMAYLAHTYPYFWESLARFGLVNSHIPMAEVIYSGGWVGLLLVAAAWMWWRNPTMRRAPAFQLLLLFAFVSGLGLWIMQGSNLVTGKLLETGEHIRAFIGPWLAFCIVPLGYALSHSWKAMSAVSRVAGIVLAGALLCGAGVFVHDYFFQYIDVSGRAHDWKELQGLQAPLQWIDSQQPQPVVIWTEPTDNFATYIPTLSRDYVLYSPGAMFTLVSDAEFHERYLVAGYFDNPSVDDLKNHFADYVGRQDAYHHAKTVERAVKLCKVLHFFINRAHDCGTVPTPVDLMGEAFFTNLETHFTQDIKLDIKTYLQKYHVSYVIKDTLLEPQVKPEAVGGKLEYNDGRYEVYRL